MRGTRTLWSDRVGQWKRSGLTAAAFAKKEGISPRTLKHWAWQLRKDAREKPDRPAPAKGAPVAFVELAVPRGIADRHSAFEIERGSWRVRVPAEFDQSTLERLLAIVEARS